jgi:maltooligosyltrehalose trehalohydrolase
VSPPGSGGGDGRPLPRRRFGPSLREGGDGATFRLFAPGAGRCELLLEAGCSRAPCRVELSPAEGGFFEADVDGVGPGARYRFSRDGGTPLPDPASRFQPDGPFGASELVELERRWRDAGWGGPCAAEMVVYELHLGAFTEEGTWAAAAGRLDHLAGLGVTALEVMPVAAFPGRRNWGYDGTFHFAPFAGYGRPEELAAFVEACHDRGLSVILDLVTNHFGPEGNAMWGLAPAFFRPDRPTAWSAGLDWERRAVLDYFDEAAVLWIRDHHMDGLRLDAFHAVPAEHRAVHLASLVGAIDRALPRGRRAHVLLESRDNQTSLLELATERVEVTQLNFDHQRAAHVLLTGERHGEYSDFAEPEVELGRCLGEGFAFRSRYSRYNRRVLGEARGPARWDQVVSYLQNHDTSGNRCLGERLDHLVDDDRLRAATALLLLHPAIPFLFMGQEWSARTPFHFFTDLNPALGRAVDEGRRRLFREIDGAEELAAAPPCQDPAALSRSRLRWDEAAEPARAAHLELVRTLLGLRRELRPRMSPRIEETAVERRGRALLVTIGPAERDGAAHLLVANLEERPLELAAPGELLFGTRPPRPGLVPPLCTQLYRC